MLLHPIYRPHLATTAQTAPALHLDHPIYHIYYIHLALPPTSRAITPYPPPPSELSQTFADYILDLLDLLDLSHLLYLLLLSGLSPSTPILPYPAPYPRCGSLCGL